MAKNQAKKKCAFCEHYESIVRSDKHSRDSVNNDPDSRVEIRYVHKVRLMSLIKRRVRGHAQYHDAGFCSYKMFPIKFCPVCGRRLW